MGIVIRHILLTALLFAAFPRDAECRWPGFPGSPADSVQAGAIDSLRRIPSYALDEIVVTATRFPLLSVFSPSRVTVINAGELGASPEKNLGELLTGRPGVLVRPYGTGASLQTVSIRGMGAEHSAVLLDGIPVGNAQTGLTDLSLFPLDEVGSIELVRGGSSAQYGSDALGGVINIRTGVRNGRSYLKLDGAAGSVGSQRGAMAARLALEEDVVLTVGTAVGYGKEDFDFMIQDGARRVNGVRTGSDFHSRHLFVKGNWQADATTDASFLVSSFDVDRGTPGPVLSVANQGSARQHDQQILAAAQLRTHISDRLALSFAGNFQNAYERYFDQSGNFPADNYYRNIMGTVQANARYIPVGELAILSGVELSNAAAAGNALDRDQSRAHLAAYTGAEVHTSPVPLWISLYPSVRFDSYSTVGQAVSPKLGVNIMWGRDDHSLGKTTLSVHSAVGRNFRVPTFNELYYAGSGGRGNVALRPERATSVDAGVTFRYPLLGMQEMDITYYSIMTEDRIQWLPTSNVLIWSPVNIGRTHSHGFEFEYQWAPLPEFLFFEANYSTIDSRKKYGSSPADPTLDKQLMYVPLETGHMSARVILPFAESSRITVTVADNYVGQRYTAEDNSSSLPPYHTLNAAVRVEVPLLHSTLALKYEMANLLNEAYEVLPRYPMPLRNHTVAFSINQPL